jgi:hypothetical protein
MERGGFVVRLGADTVAAERYVRTARRLEGDLFNRSPAPRLTHYVVTLDERGHATEVEVRTRRPDGTPMPGGALGMKATFRNDSVAYEVQLADSVARPRGAVPAGTLVALPNSYAMWELGLRAMRGAGRDSGAITFHAPGAQRPQSLPARFTGGDAARVEYFGDPVQVTVDAAGRILAVDGSQTTNKVMVTRDPGVDVGALAQAARPMGQASPRDTARATVGAAELLVDYSRPSVRGRTVWGGTLVPHGQVWRLGANAATQLRTSRDLVLGGTPVPAGTYTLFLMPGAQGHQLIVNRQVGQWGTEYDAKQDLARVPVTATPLTQPVEQFTIAVEPAGTGGGTLVMRWERQQLSVPFTVR